MSDYLDCELHVTDRDQASLAVSGREYSGRPELGEELQERLRTLLDPKDYGSALFSGLFALDGELLSGYRQALAAAQDARKRLRFRLHIAPTAPPDVHALRWELLYDGKKSTALGCSRELAFSRYSSIPELQGTPVKEKPRLLVAIAGPTNLTEYGLDEINRDSARRTIEKALAPLANLVSWELLWEPGQVTAANLSDRLAEGAFHVLHLQAHGIVLQGEATAHAVLEGEDGRADFVDEEFFAQIFEGARNLRLVTLVACHGGMQSADDPFSGLGPGLVQRGIPAVVAMRQPVSFSTAARFCEHFYKNLARSGYVDKAVNEARNHLRLSLRESADWGAPILFMRLKDGLLFEPQALEPAPVQARSNGETHFNWEALTDCIAADGLLPFLGPDVCRGLLPSREEVAQSWIGKYRVPLDQQRDLSAVAQFVEAAKEGVGRPHDLLLRLLAEDLPRRDEFPHRERLQGRTLSEVISSTADLHFTRHPREPHLILANLPISTYVTTNPDSFLVEALRRQGSAPVRQHCLWREDMRDPTILERYKGLRGTLKEPLVFHIYGSDEDPTSLVLTEDNHLDFLRAVASDPGLLPVHLQSSLTKSMLLFLGYDPRRLDSRVLLRGLLAHRKDLRRERYAVLQIDPKEGDAMHAGELRSFLESSCQQLLIRVYWGTVDAFLGELRDRWNREGRRGRL